MHSCTSIRLTKLGVASRRLMLRWAILGTLGLAPITTAHAQTPPAEAPSEAAAESRMDAMRPPGEESRPRDDFFDAGPPFRHGFGGGMRGRGMGMGMGPGEGPAREFAAEPKKHWEDTDRRLRECRDKFEKIEKKRTQLLDELIAAKKNYQPERMDPASLLTRKSIDTILGTLHQAVEDQRDNAEEAGELLANALIGRMFWEPVLRQEAEKKPSPAGAAPTDAARRQAWLEGAAALEREGMDGFAKAVLGDRFGPAVVQALPERLRRPGTFMMRPGRGGPMRRQMMETMRQNWQARIERMERQQEELGRELQRQSRELRQMHSIMENVLSEPGAPDEDDAAPQAGADAPQRKTPSGSASKSSHP